MNHPLIYKKATKEDIDVLTWTRIEVLRAVNKLADDVDMAWIEKISRDYYTECFQNDSHAAYLVFNANRFVGCGGINFYSVMPTYHNPSGKRAYIMNIYVRPEYRRKGIAEKMVDLLVQEARNRNISQISLTATSMGQPVYEHYGFSLMKNEMELLDEL